MDVRAQVESRPPRQRAAILFSAGVGLLLINSFLFMRMGRFQPITLLVLPVAVLLGGIGLVRPSVMEQWSTLATVDRVLQVAAGGGGILLGVAFFLVALG